MISSLSEVPPVVTIQLSGGSMCLPISLTMAEVWSASSRVGMSTNTGKCQGGDWFDVSALFRHKLHVQQMKLINKSFCGTLNFPVSDILHVNLKEIMMIIIKMHWTYPGYA